MSSTAIDAAVTALVLKERMMLGVMPDAQRAAALALAWCALPAEAVLREADVNAALKAWLAGVGRFLAIDHVELRRWLVDGGWLARDGYGREYRRVGAGALRVEQAPLAAALAGRDVAAWVDGLRAEEAARRDAKRAAWERRQAAGAS